MKDFVTSKERLSNPRWKLITEDLKASILFFVLFIGFLIAITQPGVNL